MTSDPEQRMAQLSAALEIYLECIEAGDPAEVEVKLAAHPELRELVEAMLGMSRRRRRPPLGQGGAAADDAPPA